MEKQKENPKSMNSSSKREKVGFNVGGAGGIVVIGATVVAAAIGAAFLAYRDKRCSNKQGADRTSENGIDEKTEKDLLDLGKLEGFSETLVIRESVNQKNETTEDNSDHEDEEKIEVALEETGDSSPESNMEAMRLSEMIDHKKSSNKEELAFGSLIEIQETNPSIGKKESKRKSSYDGSTIDIETAKETVEASTVDIENNPSYDFSFWNNDLNKHKEIEEIIKEASEKSEERPYDVFELEDEQRNKEVESESFAAFQNDDNVDKEDEESEDDNENGMKQQFADHSLIKNSNTGEDAECLVLAKTKKTTNMFMDHISKGLFLLVLAMSIVVVILSILAQQDHLYYYYDHHLPHFCREIFQIFSASINQTAEIQ